MTLAVGKDNQYGGKVLLCLSGKVEFLPRNSLLTLGKCYQFEPDASGRNWTSRSDSRSDTFNWTVLDTHTHLYLESFKQV